MALHEKNLSFEGNLVDITRGAQFEPWFLEINPRAEVPVLQDIGKIIPDSTRIIDYLEDNFSNGNDISVVNCTTYLNYQNWEIIFMEDISRSFKSLMKINP